MSHETATEQQTPEASDAADLPQIPSSQPLPEKVMVVGLGNPGAEYAGHRHNVGYWTVNRLARRHGIKMDASRLASTGHGKVGDVEVVLVKPRTYVNRSGLAVAALMKREGVPVENVIVIYDELDLPEGRLRLRRRGKTASNNGIKSIIAETGSGDFGRVRIGIGRPHVSGEPSWDPEVVAAYVLSEPSKEGKAVLEAAVERAADAVEAVIEQGWDRAMNTYNAA
jgi:PTH1 family peptidyl-tRNA hydrolase